jgi:hypothetical protein
VITRGVYTVDRMVRADMAIHAAAMHPSAVSSSLRPADNELYDRGCDLVEAAAAIRRLAADPCAARAVPAVLGCLEAALQELSRMCAVMEKTIERAAQSQSGNHKPRRDAVAERMRRGFSNLDVALADAEDAAMTARALAGRSLGG